MPRRSSDKVAGSSTRMRTVCESDIIVETSVDEVASGYGVTRRDSPGQTIIRACFLEPILSLEKTGTGQVILRVRLIGCTRFGRSRGQLDHLGQGLIRLIVAVCPFEHSALRMP